MRVASIDIGTNSVLLLIAEKSEDSFKVLHEIQELPRLGKGVDKDRKLSVESRRRVLDVLTSYKSYLSRHYPELVSQTVVTATSAVRDASNKNTFLAEVLSETGWNIRILSGNAEAQTTFKGALTVLDTSADKKYLVLDIGGGSTEIAMGTGFILKSGISIDMGSVRYSERFFQKPMVDFTTASLVRAAVRKKFNAIDIFKKPYIAVGVAGTVTSIAAVSCGLKSYDTSILNGYLLSRTDVDRCIEKFIDKTSEEIESLNPLFLRGRGDVILAGAIILSEFLSWCHSDSITVSTGGIRHGILS